MTDEPHFLVVGRVPESSVPKFWTGRMNGKWPEYARDRRKGMGIAEGAARSAASEFNGVTALVQWAAEPASSFPIE